MSLSEPLFPLDALTAAAVHQAVAVAHVEDMPAAVANRPAVTFDDTHALKYALAVTLAVEGQATQSEGAR